MMKKSILILVLVLLILFSGIGIVSAETLTGSLGNSASSSVASYNLGAEAQTSWGANQTLNILGIESVAGLTTIVHFDYSTAMKMGYAVGAPAGISGIPFIARYNSLTGPVIGTGTFGYQRIWNGDTPPVEQAGYQYWLFDTWNGSTLYSGNATVYLEMNNTAAYTPGPAYSSSDSGKTSTSKRINVYWKTGSPAYSNYGVSGDYLITTSDSVLNDYTVTSPGGAGATGTIYKSSGGINYTSRAYVFNASGSVLATESSATGTNLVFNVPSTSVKIGIQSPNMGTWYNTSILFSPGVTITPTPTPSPTVTLNPGEFWLTFSAEDATTGGLIPGAEIDIYSEFAGTWNNATTTSGERTVASSQNHVYDAYGYATGYTNGSALDKIAYPNQNYLIKLFPTSGLPDVPGYINLFVSVTERETGSPISGVSVTVSTPGSYTVNGETDSTGSEDFSTSNSSVKYITVSKTGYKSETRTITTPAFGSYNAALQMSRIVVTTVPTGYIPPGGVTPVTTMDPRSATEKDTDMMNMIRDSGPQLIQLAIAVTMISLLGLMTKGFGK